MKQSGNMNMNDRQQMMDKEDLTYTTTSRTEQK